MFGQKKTAIKWAIILGVPVLLVLLIPEITAELKRLKIRDTKKSMEVIAEKLQDYKKECGGLPETLEGLTQRSPGCKDEGGEPYLKEVPLDAWGRKFVYKYYGGDYDLKVQSKYDGMTAYEACKAMERDGLGCHDWDGD